MEAMGYLLKPWPMIVAGLTLGVAIATATAVAKLRIKQFWAIPLAGKVVAPCPVMALPLFLLYRHVGPRSRTHGAAGRFASGGDRYRHEDVSRMAGDAGRVVAQRQERRDWHVEHQPAVAEAGEGQAIETAEGEAGRRQDAQAFQANATGCVQAAVPRICQSPSFAMLMSRSANACVLT